MKNIQKNVIFSGLGYMLPIMAALITIPVMVKHLGTDLYGLYAICISLVGGMTLVDLGVGQTIVKFVAEYEVTNKRHEVKPLLDIALLIYCLIGLGSAGILYVFSPEMATLFYQVNNQRILAQQVLHLTAVALFFSYVTQFFVNVCRAYHRFDIPAIIQNIGSLGGILLSSILLIFGYGLIEVMIAYIVIYAVGLAYAYVACLRILPSGVTFGFAFNQVVFQRVIGFSFYVFVNNFVSAVTSRADKLLIGAIIGAEAVTFYQVPYTIAQMANGIVHSLVQVVFPHFSELASLNEEHKLLQLYKRVTQAVLLLSMLIAVLLLSVGGEFLKLWLSPAFAEQSTLTLQIMAAYFFLQSNIVTSYWVVQSKGNAKLIALVSIIGITIYLISVYWLGKHFGHNGAAVALFALVAPVPIWLFWLQKHVGHRFFEYLVWLLVTATIGIVLSYLLVKLNGIIDESLWAILTDGVLVMGIPLLTVWLLFKRKPLVGLSVWN